MVACSPNGGAADSSSLPDPATVDFAHQASDIVMDEDVTYGKLPNGLRYAVMENDTPSQTATLLMRFDAGSLDETPETAGIAHFLEHMAFNGSDALPEGEMIKTLERLGLAFGPDTNASTSFDQTTYQLELPEVSDSLLDEALSIFRETASRLTLDADAIDRERGVIQAERRSRNSPGYRAAIAGLAFQTEAVRLVEKLPIGTEETIDTVTAEQFRDFYHAQYRPEDTFVVLVGDRPVEQMIGKIEAAFADWQAKGDPAPDAEVDAFSYDEPRYGAFFDPEITSSISLSAIQPPLAEAKSRDTLENRAERIPAFYGTAIMNRRFARKVRDGEADYTGAGVSEGDIYGAAQVTRLSVTAEPDKLGDGFIQAERLLRQAIDYGFTQDELDEQMASMRKRMEVSVQTAPTRRTSTLARMIMNNFAGDTVLTTPASQLERYDAIIAGITLNDVNTAFSEMMDRLDDAPQMYLQGERAIDDPKTYLSDLLEQARAVTLEPDLQEAAGEFAYSDWGTPGKVAERGRIDDIGITTVRFENGVRLNMKATPYEQDVIRISARIDGGTAQYPRDAPAFPLQMSSIIGRSGLAAHTSDQLSTILAGQTVGVSRSFGLESMALSGATVPVDLDRQFELMAASLTEPAFRDSAVPNFQSQIRSVWSKIDSTPSGAAGIALPSLLSSNHWRNAHPSEAQALTLDLTALRAEYESHLQGGPIEIAVVGDFEDDDVIDAVARTFGALPERPDTTQPVPEDATNLVFPNGRARPYVITHQGEPETALLGIYWPIADHSDVMLRRRMGVLSRVVRLQLTELLREQEGATYSPSAFTTMPETSPNWGYLGVSIELEPGELDRIGALVEAAVADLVDNGIEPDLFDRAIEPRLESLDTSLENNGYWQYVIAEAQTGSDRLDNHRSREAAFQNMTAQDISALAQDVFKPGDAVRVHVLPET